MQIFLIIGTIGLLSFIMPVSIFQFDPSFNIFSLPKKNLIALGVLMVVGMGISYLLKKQVKEPIVDERNKIIAKNAAYYTLNVLIFGFLAAILIFRAFIASNPLPEYEYLVKVFSVVIGITTWVYAGLYYILLRKN